MADGRLRVDGHLTRSGVFVYRNPDGTQRREYRPPAEVFHADSLSSFAMLPVTNDHPDGLLSAANIRQHAVGWTGETVRQDDDHVAAPLMIVDAGVIGAVESGKQELSCGYECDLKETPGMTPDGQRYDAVQTNIRGNHVAIVAVGRAGSSARMRMDAAVMDAEWSTAYINDLPDSAFLYIEAGGEKDSEGKTTPRSLRHFPVRDASGNVDMAHVHNALSRIPQSNVSAAAKAAATAKAERMMPAHRGDRMETIDQNGQNKLEAAAQMLAQAKTRADAAEGQLAATTARADKAEGEAATLKARVDKLEADPDRLEGAKLRILVGNLTAEVDKLKSERARFDAEEPQRFAKAVGARAKLVAEAAEVLGGEPKFDASSDRELMTAVLRKINPVVRIDEGTSDQYVKGAYDPAIESWRRTREALSEISRPAATVPLAARADAPAEPRDAREASDMMMRKLYEAGRAPLPSTKAMRI